MESEESCEYYGKLWNIVVSILEQTTETEMNFIENINSGGCSAILVM